VPDPAKFVQWKTPASTGMPTGVLSTIDHDIITRDFASSPSSDLRATSKVEENERVEKENLRLYLDTLKATGVGECALETSKSERDVFISDEEAAVKTKEAIHHREYVHQHKTKKIDSAPLAPLTRISEVESDEELTLKVPRPEPKTTQPFE